MNKILFLVVPGLLFFFACSKKEEQKKVPVTYEMQNFRMESEGGCMADTLPCALYVVDFPVFSGFDSAVAKVIQKEIDASVSMGNPEVEGETMAAVAKGFIEDYADFKTEFPQDPMGWHYSGVVEVEVLTDSLLSLSVAEEYFTGGAHGGYGTYYINLRPATGEVFNLTDYFKPGFGEPLRTAAEKAFRKVRKLPDSASMDDNLFEFPDNSFQFNENYGFTQEGIVFFFNSYEIAPFAAGPTEVLVPYADVKEWIKQ
ncbi:MAG: DUF3298 domain-containing protein [Chryseolinea sp.]